MSQLKNEYIGLGEKWVQGFQIVEWQIGNKTLKLLPSQIDFINSKERFCLYCGGFGCGKSLALMIKMIFQCLCFPNNLVMLGRKTLLDIDRTILKDLFDLLPAKTFRHKIKEGVIEFWNGSQIILFGLDSLMTGSQQDIKKSSQKIKSLNLGSIFLDQLEEIEYSVFELLSGRLRRSEAGIRQINATCNPALFWAYDFFKINPKKRTDVKLIQGSMLDNKENLPDDYIQDQLSHPESYVRKFVYGDWSPDVMIQQSVFAPEHILRLEKSVREPIDMENGCEIWVQPDKNSIYRIGVDPSEGVIDPSSISVISEESLARVAGFNGFLPIHGLAEKVKFLSEKYTTTTHPLIIPETTGSGLALVNEIKDLKVYCRKEIPPKWHTGEAEEKLGFKTTWQTKRVLISNFQKLLEKNPIIIYDKKTVDEFKVFIWTDSVRQRGAGAEIGFHDDNVISILLAFWDFPIKKLASKFEQFYKAHKDFEKRMKARARPRNQYF